MTCRVDGEVNAFLLEPELLKAVTEFPTKSGLLALLVRENDGGTLTARTEGSEITLDPNDRMHAVTAVHQLLHRVGIFISTEKADL